MDPKSENQKVNYGKGDPNLKKTISLQKSEYLKALLKLKHQEHIIEKTISSHFENAKIDTKILQDIQRDYHSLLKEREKIFDSLKTLVDDVNEGWKAVKNVIQDLQNFGNLDVDGYKSKLYNLWGKIQEFYKKEFIDLLIEEQNALESDLMQFNMTLHRYENCRDFKGSLISSKNAYTVNYMESDWQDYDEVENFSSLVAKTGHTQNWSDEDHFLFIKLRKKHKTIPALVNAIQNKCPDLSAKCIVNHEAWYKFYLKLREQQKKSVKEWRKQKDFERSIRTAEKDESDIQENVNESKTFGEIKEKLSRHKFDKSEKSPLINKESEVDEKRELIKKWREEKENKRLMNEEQEKLGKQLRELSENRRKARAERLKNAVVEYKKRKALETAFSKKIPNQNGQENILKSIDLIKSFREQDKHYIEKRRRILDARKENSWKEIKKDEKIDSSKPRVSTLLKYTKVWREKWKIIDKEEGHQNLLYIKNLPKMSTNQLRNQGSIPENTFY